MKEFIIVVKILAFGAVLSLLAALFFFLKGFRKEFAQTAPLSKKRLDLLVETKPHHSFKRGEREFTKAKQLVAMGELAAAREKLLFIQNIHADSEFGPEARRILGEINLDHLLSTKEMANKAIHVVKSGDTFLRIAKKYKTTLDCIMFLNGQLDGGRLHPGDRLIVMPLDFKLVIDLKNERIELYHREPSQKAHVFVKEYPVLKSNLPKLGRRSIHTKIISKISEMNGRSYKPVHQHYRNGKKVLGLRFLRRNVQIRAISTADAVDLGSGIFLSGPAIEELAMLIRFGNEVEVKPAR